MALMNRSSNSNHAPISDINVTPFVDVMLVLLVIFMITSPMLVAGVDVDLPETTASPVSGQDEPVSVTINSKGKIFLQDMKVSKSDLVTKLRAVAGEKNDIRIFVRGDKRVDYGKIMDVVGLINSAGFTKVALLTDIES